MNQGEFQINFAVSAEDIASIRMLFQEYANGLEIDLEYQGFAQELDRLPGLYGPPQGALLLAKNSAGTPCGCVAIRPLSESVCELKRLYVKEEGRGHGLGRQLTRTALEVARQIGYSKCCLDTLETMTAPIQLYRSEGFEPISAYYPNPIAGTVFFEKPLVKEQ